MKQSSQFKELLPIVLAGTLLCPAMAQAESPTPEFTFDAVNVTAMRYAQKDIDTPADTAVYSGEALRKTGAGNVATALQYKAGLIYHTMAPHGQSWITSATKVSLRGIDDGALVMLNGVPMSFNGISHLDQISLDQVERVEIIKGGGAVLYGSEAFGGVINVITKQQVDNQVSLGVGNQGQRDYQVSVQAGKASISVGHSEYGATPNLTEQPSSQSIGVVGSEKYLVAFRDSQKDRLALGYCFDDAWQMQYAFQRKDYGILYNRYSDNALLKQFDYTDDEHFWQLRYQRQGWDAKLFYQERQTDYQDFETARPAKVEWEDMNSRIWGVDGQKVWDSANGKWLAGLTVKRETFADTSRKLNSKSGALRDLEAAKAMGPFARNQYSLYGQWDTPVSASTRLIFSAREDITRGDDDNRFSAFLPQLQAITKLDEQRSWYINVGKSFRVPSFRQMYYSSAMVVPNPDLKPESGINYELGYKQQLDQAAWKAVLFHTEIKDQLTWQKINSSTSQPVNANGFRNTGLEVSFEKQCSGQLSYTLGAMYGNPERQDTAGAPWNRVQGRVQLSGGVQFDDGTTSAALHLAYFGDRVMYKKSERSPMLSSSLQVSRKLDERQTLTLDVENLFDRHDAVNNGNGDTTDYYTMPRTYRLTWQSRF